MGPSTLFDKSFLQALNRDEAAILDALFRTNITPLFFAETLADLEGGLRGGQTPGAIVGNLAAKTPVLHGTPVASHQSLALGDLFGHTVGMDGRPALGGGRCVTVEGKKGIVFDEMPEMEAFNRWQSGDFLGVERQFARAWRDALQAAPRDVESIVGVDGTVLKLRGLHEVKTYVDELVDARGPGWALLKGVMLLLNAPPYAQRAITDRWKRSGRPRLKTFAPYAAHYLTVELFFQVAAATGKIAIQRPSNRIDVAYLHYLPFAELFVSGDKLHQRIAPLFLRPDQQFITSAELKAGLTALDAYYSTHPDVPTEGLMRVAAWPPLQGNFAISSLFDDLRPQWRAHASRPPLTVSPEAHARIIAEMKAYRDRRQAIPSPRNFSVDEADSVILERRVPVRRGRYQFMPVGVKADAD